MYTATVSHKLRYEEDGREVTMKFNKSMAARANTEEDALKLAMTMLTDKKEQGDLYGLCEVTVKIDKLDYVSNSNLYPVDMRN